MRLLLDIEAQFDIADLRLELEYLSVTAEPEDPDGFYLTVDAPLPNSKYDRIQWGVTIDRWEIDEMNEEGDPTQSHSEPVVRCVLAERPDTTDIVAMLKLAPTQ